MIIKVEDKNISKYKTEIEYYINCSKGNLTNIKNTLSDMNSVWKGSAAQNFFAKTNDYLEEINKTEESMKTFNTFLNEYLKSLNKIENDYTSEKLNIE